MEHLGFNVVVISQYKGGVAKTSLCGAGAWAGANYFNSPSYVIHTDNSNPPTIDAKRNYQIIDCQYAGDHMYDEDGERLEELNNVWSSLEAIAPKDKRSMLFVDNGGNKPALSVYLSQKADLVCIPTEITDASFASAIKNYNDILSIDPDANVIFIGVKHRAQLNDTQKEIINDLPDEIRERLHLLGKCEDVIKFTNNDKASRPWKSPRGDTASYARKFFKVVLDNLPKDK